MGMLGAAFLQGAGQGMQTLSQGLMRGVERDEEQKMWEKRAALLEKIRIESAKTIKQAEIDIEYSDANASKKAAAAATLLKSTEASKTEAEIARINSPEYQAAKTGEAERNRSEAVKNADAARQAEMDATIAKGGSKEYRAALKALADASRAPDTTDYAGRKLDNAIKQIAVDNANHIAELKKEFGKPETPQDRKQAIREELSVLTGKDADKFLPVPLKDEMGNVTGYKIFDTKSGRWVEEGKPAVAPPKGAVDMLVKDPTLAGAFDQKYGAGAAAQVLKQEPAKNKSELPARPAPDNTTPPASGSLREQWQAERKQAEPQRQEQTRVAGEAAQKALSAKDKFAAEDAMKMAGFNELDQATKVAVRKLVMGVR